MEIRLIIIKDEQNTVKEFTDVNEAIGYLMGLIPVEDLVLKDDEEVVIQKKKPSLVKKILGKK